MHQLWYDRIDEERVSFRHSLFEFDQMNFLVISMKWNDWEVGAVAYPMMIFVLDAAVFRRIDGDG